ncbi:MAG: NAD-dependent epimerase/dehydratase family protein, partial [Verrucomicrobiota bacterium]
MEPIRPSPVVQRKCLIVGCGYVGLPLGKELARQGHQVFGLRRSRLVEAELLAAGITPLHADLTQPETLARLPRQYDWVVNCTASGGGGAEDYRKIYLEGNRNLLNWLGEAPPEKFIYTSSTSVYGQNDGAVVTETSPTEPDADTA